MNAKAIEVSATGAQSTTRVKATFVRYAGGCFVNARAVAIYDIGGGMFRLQVETASGKRATIREDGETVLIRCREVSGGQLDRLTTEWSEGCYTSKDATIAYRALCYMIPDYE